MIVFIKHVREEGPGALEVYFAASGYHTRTVELGEGEALPCLSSDIQGVVSLGGPMNVYEEDKYAFLADEERFIRGLLERHIPFLGICLGCQLLAKTGGAGVGPSPVKELGVSRVALSREGRRDPLFRDMEDEFPAFQWHEDTFDIPREGVFLAGGDGALNQAFRLGESAYGLQFHLEATEAMVAGWMGLGSGAAKQSREKALTALTEFRKEKASIMKNAERLFVNFEEIVRKPAHIKRK